MIDVRLYGRFHGAHSLAQVAEGFAEVLPEASKFDLDYWQNTLDEVAQAPRGVTAPVAIFLGPLDQLPLVAQRGKHERVLVMVAPNSNRLGGRLLSTLEGHATEYLVPSTWAALVLRMYVKKPVTVVRHGVSTEYYREPGPRYEKFSMLHLSSTLGERKGTAKLIEAWQRAALPDASLYLSVPTEAMISTLDAIADSGAQDVQLTRRLNYDPREMRTLYSRVHYVCQPSRGEGFGLVPLEARACGTPVIATSCTGHSEHMFGPGVMLVPTREMAPIDDLPGATAPSLHVDDLAAVLVRAYEEREQQAALAEASADVLREAWSWPNQLKEFRDGLESS